MTFSAGLLWTAGLIFLLLIISAFLSGSETALTATSKARILRLQQEGQRRARWVIFLLEQKERLFSAILLGNIIVNILASALTTRLFLEAFGESGVVYATLVMTVMVVVFAEVLPKTYAILAPEITALRAAGPLRVLVVVLAPITRALSFISGTILRLTGLAKSAEYRWCRRMRKFAAPLIYTKKARFAKATAICWAAFSIWAIPHWKRL